MEWEHGGSFCPGDQTWDGSSGAMGAEPNQVVPIINCSKSSILCKTKRIDIVRESSTLRPVEGAC